MSRDQWKTVRVPLNFKTDSDLFMASTTNAYSMDNLNTSTNKMPRVVNMVPTKKDDGAIVWTKRNGFQDNSDIGYTINWIYFWDNGQSYTVWGDTGTLISATFPTWASSSTDPTAFYTYSASETQIGGITYITWITHQEEDYDTSPDNTAANHSTAGWFTVDGMTTGNFTGSTTSGSAIITGITSTANMHVGQVISNAVFPTTNYVYILSIDSGTQITVSENANATGSQTLVANFRCRILDADFPGNVAGKALSGPMISMDGYVFALTTAGEIYNSDLNSIQNWTSTGYLTMTTSPDRGVCLEKYKNMIVGFSRNSIEFFRDVGNATGSPLQLIGELTIRMGVQSTGHVTKLHDSLYFIGASKEHGSGLYVLDGTSPRKVSTPDIEYAMQSSVDDYGPANYKIMGFTYRGKNCIMLYPGPTSIENTSNTNKNTTFVYYVDEDVWTEWRASSTLTAWPWKWIFSTQGYSYYDDAINVAETLYAVSQGGHITMQQADGLTKYLDFGYNTTLTSTTSLVFTTMIQTPPLDLGTNRKKRLNKFRLIGNTATGTDPMRNCTLYWSDDFGETWVTRAGASTQKDLTGLGSFRERIFRLVDSNEGFAHWRAIELDYSETTK